MKSTHPLLHKIRIAILALVLPAATIAAVDPLIAGFTAPPASARPQTWWHWMNGNITREGITADLEAMHRIGIGEANIITVASGIPAGPVPVMSPQFFDMVEFAAKEADRLGMTLCMDNCPGWSSSGGPWVPPEHAMQRVTTSEVTVEGGAPFAGTLGQPPTKGNYYRDIAVFAFKTPAGEDPLSPPGTGPVITTSVSKLIVTSLLSGDSDKPVRFPVPTAAAPFYVQIEYSQPVLARTVLITPAQMRQAGGKILTSNDGILFDVACPFVIAQNSTSPIEVSLGAQPVSARFFRLQFDHANPQSNGVALRQLKVSGRLYISDLANKAGFDPHEVDPLAVERDGHLTAAPDLFVHRETMIDLTSALDPSGGLRWNAPPGRWTILRIGATLTGVTNHPAPPEATGLECDKLSPDGLDASWQGMMQPILKRLGQLGRKVMVDCLIDSYETGGQNWTPRMVEEFKARRGYDPTSFLPALTGRVVDSPAVTERFLWDLRRTIADLFAQNYFAHFTELCHLNGMQSLIEPYTGPFESLQSGGGNDVPMAEFWAGQKIHASVKMAASVGHTYGQKVIAAESFTGGAGHGNWMDDPYSLKALGDLAFSQGINRFVFHRYAHQPWLDRYPGMTMGQWGINLDRTNTWFEMAKPWMDYLARCQFLLQQGRAVADVAYFCGQSTPVLVRSGDPALPAGFDYDNINAEVLLGRSRVIDHRIVLASGASYAVLVLPASDPELTPQLLEKLRQLANDGAVILGGRPQHSPSLQDYPACDQAVQALAAAMWGASDAQVGSERPVGRGRVITGQSLDQVLATAGVSPDFKLVAAAAEEPMTYIHRQLDGADLYFVANPRPQAAHAEAVFRVSGKIPELWHPDTGMREEAPAYRVRNGSTTVPLDFDPCGSIFVVFREADSASGDHDVVDSRNVKRAPAIPVDGPWVVSFPAHWGAPDTLTLPQLASWPEIPDPGIKYFSGTATYRKQIDIPATLLGEGLRLTLDLGEVKNLAQVSLNGTDLGIVWKPPFQVDLTAAAKVGANHLEVKVVNLWPNRMIGDEQLPPDVEWAGMALKRLPEWLADGKPSPTGRLTFATWHHITKAMPLLRSGLIGPVTLISPPKKAPRKSEGNPPK